MNPLAKFRKNRSTINTSKLVLSEDGTDRQTDIFFIVVLGLGEVNKHAKKILGRSEKKTYGNHYGNIYPEFFGHKNSIKINNCPKNGKVFRGKYQFLSEKIQNFINCRTENHQKNSTTANSFYNRATGKRFKFGGDKPPSARKITHFGVIQQVTKSVLI